MALIEHVLTLCHSITAAKTVQATDGKGSFFELKGGAQSDWGRVAGQALRWTVHATNKVCVRIGTRHRQDGGGGFPQGRTFPVSLTESIQHARAGHHAALQRDRSVQP